MLNARQRLLCGAVLAGLFLGTDVPAQGRVVTPERSWSTFTSRSRPKAPSSPRQVAPSPEPITLSLLGLGGLGLAYSVKRRRRQDTAKG